HALRESIAQPRRTGHHEATLTTGKLLIQYEKGNATKVVAVEVREEHGINCGGLQSQTRERDEGGRSAIEQDVRRLRTHRNARLKATAATEGVARSDELHGDHRPAY